MFLILILVIVIAMIAYGRFVYGDDTQTDTVPERTYREPTQKPKPASRPAPLILDSPEALSRLQQIYRCLLSAKRRFSEPSIYWMDDRAVFTVCLEDMDVFMKLWHHKKDPEEKRWHCDYIFDTIFPDASLCGGLFSRSHSEEFVGKLCPSNFQGWIYGEPYVYSPDDNFDLCYLVYDIPVIYPSNEDEKKQLIQRYNSLIKG